MKGSGGLVLALGGLVALALASRGREAPSSPAPAPAPPAGVPLRPLFPDPNGPAVPLQGLDAEVAAALDRVVLPPFVPVSVGPYVVLVGADAPSLDGERLSVSHVMAQVIADTCACLLPTPPIVDGVEAAAAVRLTPHPQKDLARMMSRASWIEHADRLNADAGAPPSAALVAPVGKDYVQVPALAEKPDRCAIYGWGGIQPVYLGHEAWYRDYSHIGPRLVSRQVQDRAGNLYDLADLYEAGDAFLAPRGPTPARHPAHFDRPIPLFQGA